jgi:hypothetical protein
MNSDNQSQPSFTQHVSNAHEYACLTPVSIPHTMPACCTVTVTVTVTVCLQVSHTALSCHVHACMRVALYVHVMAISMS